MMLKAVLLFPAGCWLRCWMQPELCRRFSTTDVTENSHKSCSHNFTWPRNGPNEIIKAFEGDLSVWYGNNIQGLAKETRQINKANKQILFILRWWVESCVIRHSWPHLLSNSVPWRWQDSFSLLFYRYFHCPLGAVGHGSPDRDGCFSHGGGQTHRLQLEEAAQTLTKSSTSFLIHYWRAVVIRKGSRTFRWCVWWIFQLTNRPPDTKRSGESVYPHVCRYISSINFTFVNVCKGVIFAFLIRNKRWTRSYIRQLPPGSYPLLP